jgi:hypothetical protein
MVLQLRCSRCAVATDAIATDVTSSAETGVDVQTRYTLFQYYSNRILYFLFS